MARLECAILYGFNHYIAWCSWGCFSVWLIISAQPKATQGTLNSWKSHSWILPTRHILWCNTDWAKRRKAKLFVCLFKPPIFYWCAMPCVPKAENNEHHGSWAKRDKNCPYPRVLGREGWKLFQQSAVGYRERNPRVWGALCSQQALCNKWVLTITLKGEVWHHGSSSAISLYAALPHTESPRAHWL